MPEMGFSFAPGARDMRLDQTGEGGSTPKGMSPQQAVKILSLRVPDRPSPTAIAPLALLQSPGARGAGAQSGGGEYDDLIRQLMEMFGGNMDLMQQQMSGNMPVPHFTPGAQKPSGGGYEQQKPHIPPIDPHIPTGPWEELPLPEDDVITEGGEPPPDADPTDWLNWKKGIPGNGLTPLF